MRMRGIFWHVLFIPPVTIVSCDVTILRDASISFSPCSRAVLISLMDSRVEVSSSSLMQMSILKSYQCPIGCVLFPSIWHSALHCQECNNLLLLHKVNLKTECQAYQSCLNQSTIWHNATSSMPNVNHITNSNHRSDSSLLWLQYCMHITNPFNQRQPLQFGKFLSGIQIQPGGYKSNEVEGSSLQSVLTSLNLGASL